MFSFDQGMLFVLASKDLVVTLRNMAELEKGTEHPKLLTVEVKNATGIHQGVGFFSLGHPTVLYFEDKPAEVPDQVVQGSDGKKYAVEGELTAEEAKVKVEETINGKATEQPTS